MIKQASWVSDNAERSNLSTAAASLALLRRWARLGATRGKAARTAAFMVSILHTWSSKVCVGNEGSSRQILMGGSGVGLETGSLRKLHTLPTYTGRMLAKPTIGDISRGCCCELRVTTEVNRWGTFGCIAAFRTSDAINSMVCGRTSLQFIPDFPQT